MLPALLFTDAAAPRGLGRPLLRAVVGVVGGGIALASLLGFLGGYWWALDLLASFRVQYVAVLGAAGALYLLFVGRVVGTALLAVAAINLVVAAPFIFATKSVPADPGPTLTVISFNVQGSNRDRGPVVDWVREQRADLVFLLESTFEWEDTVERVTDMPYSIAARVPDRFTFGITLLARDGLSVDAKDLALGDRPVVEATVDFDGGPVQVLAIHPKSPTSADRTAKRDRILDGAALWARSRTTPVAVVGDLNASPWSAAFRRLASNGDLENSMSGFGFQPTWPSGWGPLMIPIDHALHSAGLEVVDRGTGPSFGSDHRSISVTFARGNT